MSWHLGQAAGEGARSGEGEEGEEFDGGRAGQLSELTNTEDDVTNWFSIQVQAVQAKARPSLQIQAFEPTRRARPPSEGPAGDCCSPSTSLPLSTARSSGLCFRHIFILTSYTRLLDAPFGTRSSAPPHFPLLLAPESHLSRVVSTPLNTSRCHTTFGQQTVQPSPFLSSV